MEFLSKDHSIVKQSMLKCSTDICNILDYKPKTLQEFLRFNDILVEYSLCGLCDEVKNDIKKFDDYIKKSKNEK